MKKLGMAAVAGLLFGLGLILSGMANPAKVLGFLDLGGPWDPSLALVMGGAIGVGLPGFAWLRRRQQAHQSAWSGDELDLPTTTDVDRPLVLGSLAFGAGWGLMGFCPGPALVALGAGWPPAFIFVAAMAAGMLIQQWMSHR